ncbi:uncharacterized protein [Channa argus]|uniref:uncharacterized protein isoform X2 n=1 Tax=Channa argus TaxID=215402 RepID=UPI0035211E30
MKAVVGLLVMLLGVASGVETYCDGRQNGAQCYGALGGTVVLHLLDNAAGKKFLWKKNSTNIIQWNNNELVYNDIQQRSFFTPSNGTFSINDLTRIDGGKYKLHLFDSTGRISALRILQLSIQAPVSSVLLVSECLSQGEMMVSCSSEGGDSLQYSWTLDGHTLTNAEFLSGNNETNSIALKQQSGIMSAVSPKKRRHLTVASYLLTAPPMGNKYHSGCLKLITHCVLNQQQTLQPPHTLWVICQ